MLDEAMRSVLAALKRLVKNAMTRENGAIQPMQHLK